MKAFNLFIGANNDTKECEVRKISSILDGFFTGYTVTRARGAWEGTQEDSVVVYVNVEDESILEKVAYKLKKELKQDAIGLAAASPLRFL